MKGNTMNNNLTHEEKYENYVNLLGLHNIKHLIPVKSVEELKRYFEEDKVLNNIPLEKWDTRGHALIPVMKVHNIYNAPSVRVCILKKAARMWLEEVFPEIMEG